MWGKLPVLSTTQQFPFSILITWGGNPQSWRICLFQSFDPPFVKGFIFDRKQLETRPNVWPGTIVRSRQLMASDGPVANIKMTRHGYDDVIREFAKRVVDTRWTTASPDLVQPQSMTRLPKPPRKAHDTLVAGSSVAWDRRSSGECRLIPLLPVPLL